MSGVVVAGLAYFGGRLPVGLTRRNRAARDGYALLANKYYLDHLYTGVVVGSIKGPIARAAYWFNQHVIDGVVNAVGIGSRVAGECSTGGSTRAWWTAPSTAPASEPRTPAASSA